MKNIDSFRNEINEIDNEILRLFLKRMNAAAKIGIVKNAAGMPIYVKDRENEVINRLLKKLKKGILCCEVTDFFQKLMEISRHVQTDLKFRNIALTGMPGCGKTAIGQIVSKALGLRFFDIDTIIEEREEMTINEIFEKGETYFRQLESKVIAECSLESYCVISTGGGAVLLDENIQMLKTSGEIYFIDRPVERILEDLDISGRPLLAGGKQLIHDLHDKRHAIYMKTCDYRIDNSGTLEGAAKKVAETAVSAAMARIGS
jgi:shikimate kinase